MRQLRQCTSWEVRQRDPEAAWLIATWELSSACRISTVGGIIPARNRISCRIIILQMGLTAPDMLDIMRARKAEVSFVCAAAFLCAASALLIRAGKSEFEPPYPPCSSCYVQLERVYECSGLEGQNCDMYGCFGGSRGCAIAGVTWVCSIRATIVRTWGVDILSGCVTTRIVTARMLSENNRPVTNREA